ncbi:MAG: DEAD/DEAH box helicase [Phycisphaerales bacterium]|nr:DEAD/DEAH box helicase [Phycisphaerales bacterium]
MQEPNSQSASPSPGTLLPASSLSHWNLHVAAHAWDLVAPIVIDSADDIRSSSSWRDRVQPFAHQVQNLITFCRRLPVTLLADDVGLGKTISAGLILSELIARKRVTRALVLAPKLLLPQWNEEMTTKFGLRALDGSAAEFDAAVESDAQVVITTYETARNRFEDPENPTANTALASFDMLILDEAHRLRNLYPDGDVRFAQVVRRLLEERRFRFVLMLTATPMQNRLWDLYSLVDCMTVARGHRNPFGTPAHFERTYCTDHSGRKIREGTQARFREILSQYLARTRRVDAKLVFPDRTVRLERATLTPFEKDVHARVAVLIQEEKLPKLASISILQALSSSVDALHEQLGNMTAKNPSCGLLRTEIERLAPPRASPDAPRFPLGSKVVALRVLLQRLSASRPDWRAVVFTGRRVTQERLVEALEQDGYTVGTIRGGDAVTNQRTLDLFRQEDPGVRVVVSTDAGAEGVNLQSSNVLVNLDLPWNPMKVEQRIGRIQRLGSKHGAVEILNVVSEGTFDEYLVGLLMTKLQTVAQTVGDIEAVLESTNLDDEVSFETAMFSMVMRSLRGQDVKKARLEMEQSWTEAKTTLAQQEKSIDDTLGQLDALHSVGAKLPDLVQPTPTMTAREFVSEALRAEGARVLESATDQFEYVDASGAIVRATHGERAEIGVRRFAPGHADFERLCERWVARDHSRLSIGDAVSAEDARTAVTSWCSAFPVACEMQLEEIESVTAEDGFDGEVVVRWRGSNRHDAFETLLRIAVGNSATVAAPNALPCTETLTARDLPIAVLRAATVAPQEDASVREFLRFYAERADEEAARAERGRERVVREEYTPIVEQEVVALHGVLSKGFDVRVRLSAKNKRMHATLRCSREGAQHVRVSDASGKPLERCAITQCDVPSEWMAASSQSGTRALAHLLQPCAITGVTLLPSEGEVSAVSQKFVRTSECAASAVTGKRAHRTELVEDHATRELLFPSEAETSDFSSQRYRLGSMRSSVVAPTKRGGADECVPCALSGIPLFPREGEQCKVTRQFVDARLLTKEDRGGRLCLASLVSRCAWSGRVILKSEFKQCALLGIALDPDELDASSVLRGVSLLRDGRAGQPQPALEGFFKTHDPERFKKIKVLTVLQGKAAGAQLVQVLTTGFLGFRPRFHYALLTRDTAGNPRFQALSAPMQS